MYKCYYQREDNLQGTLSVNYTLSQRDIYVNRMFSQRDISLNANDRYVSLCIDIDREGQFQVTKRSRARVTILGQCVLLQISLKTKMLDFFE